MCRLLVNATQKALGLVDDRARGAVGNRPSPDGHRAGAGPSLARSATVLLGMERSGTTWLANILNSHPQAFYIHERLSKPRGYRRPASVDEAIRSDGHISPQQRLELLGDLSVPNSAWHRPPFFAKQFRRTPPWLNWALWLLAKTTGCGKGLFRRAASPSKQFDLVFKGNWSTHAVALLQSLDARLILLLRHPCDVVASILRGQRLGLLPPVDRTEFFQSRSKLLTSLGFAHSALFAMDECEFLAVYWLVCNLIHTQTLETWPRSRLVIYEELCQDPVGLTRSLFDFLGWEVTPQTFRFLEKSTSARHSWLRVLLQVKRPYYAVYRRSDRQRARNRHELSDRQRDLVLSIVKGFPYIDRWK
jgi:hypothetical protein